MIQGEIYTFPLPDLIQWAALTTRTGELAVVHGANKIVIYFAGGKVAGGSFDMTISDSPGSVRVMLATAVKWKWGHFEFKDSALQPKIAAANMNLPAEFLLKEVINGAKSEDESADDELQNEWLEADSTFSDVNLADSLRLKVADRLLREDFRVPAMPEVTVKLMNLTRNDDFTLDELTDTIVTDQAIVASIMRYANSALHNHQQGVQTVPAAVRRLGSDQVINISLAASLAAKPAGRDLFAPQRKALWSHSAAAALFASNLADKVDLDRNVGFLCGLLMDFGMSVLYTLTQEVLGRNATIDESVEDSTSEIVRVYHQGVGRIIGGKWRLPEAVIESMAHHHNLGGAESHREYIALSALADSLANYALSMPREELQESLTESRAEQFATLTAAQCLKLDINSAIAVFRDLPRQLDQATQLIGD